MSRINELIQELCPNGVEYGTLGRVTKNFDRQRRPVTRASRVGGPYPYYGANGVQDHVADYIFDGTYLLMGEDGSVTGPHGRPVLNWATGKIWVNNHAHVLQSASPDLNLRFLYFYLATVDISNLVTGGTQPKLNQRNMNSIAVPVPPLEVQDEIVRILDSFSALTAELEAELEARRSQYEHYRDTLLSNVPHEADISLGAIFEMRAGVHIKAAEIDDQPSDEKPIPCYGGNGLRGYVNGYNYNQDVLLVGRQGALCGNVHRAKGKIYATEHAVVVTPADDVDMSWAFHKLTHMDLNQYKSKSAQPGLAVGKIKNLSVPAVPLADQERTGKVLDKFDTLVNDLTSGLPAEIVARRKQYEYYRDRLLTFEEAPA